MSHYLYFFRFFLVASNYFWALAAPHLITANLELIFSNNMDLHPKSPIVPFSPLSRNSGMVTSPLGHKRRRGIVAAAKAGPDAFAACISPTPSADGANPPLSQPEQHGGGSEALHLAAGMHLSLAKLEIDSHAVRMKTAKLEDGDKQTSPVYARAVASYEKWWAAYQLQLRAADPSYTAIPAFPVTAAKAVMFLDYGTMRPKVSHLSSFISMFCV